MGGAPQVAMRVTSQIWQIIFASQTLQVFCFCFANPLSFLFGPSQKSTICSSDGASNVVAYKYIYILKTSVKSYILIHYVCQSVTGLGLSFSCSYGKKPPNSRGHKFVGQ
jgi:hypothetical protein